jgi:phosphatidylglycerophosphatase A
MKNRLSRLLATGFYSGYAPIAPGTVGSAVGLFIFAVFPGLRNVPLLVLCAVVFFIGVKTATEIEKTDGHDAPIVNIDEIVGMWISLLFLSDSLSWQWWIVAFFVFRLFDIIKPFPVRGSQKLPAGWGIMIDDVLAGIYTNISIRLLVWLYLRLVS